MYTFGKKVRATDFGLCVITNNNFQNKDYYASTVSSSIKKTTNNKFMKHTQTPPVCVRATKFKHNPTSLCSSSIVADIL